MKAKIIRAREVMFDKPGGTHLVKFLYQGDMVEIIEGERYEDRTWNDKVFIKVRDKQGAEGFITAYSISPLKGRVKREKTDNGS